MHIFAVIESYLASSGLMNNLLLKEIPPLYKHTVLVWMLYFYILMECQQVINCYISMKRNSQFMEWNTINGSKTVAKCDKAVAKRWQNSGSKTVVKTKCGSKTVTKSDSRTVTNTVAKRWQINGSKIGSKKINGSK
ncbi:hypothetical protein Hanom_Chr11g01022271 [Helianthus anomalus]